jgi:Icc-related predicted phosphoesterase
MRIAAISDLHGQLPTIAPCDLLLIGGDICPHFSRQAGSPRDMRGQAHWLDTTFRAWLNQVPARHVVAVAGNHDFVFERAPELLPALRWHYLLHNTVTLDGLLIWGAPYQLPFYDWAFNRPEHELARHYATIPHHVDIVLSHGPPYGYGDLVTNPRSPHVGTHVGSPALAQFIHTHRPPYVITGHIHSARGIYPAGATTVLNASILDEEYRLAHPPFTFKLAPRA